MKMYRFLFGSGKHDAMKLSPEEVREMGYTLMELYKEDMVKVLQNEQIVFTLYRRTP